jgi:chromosome segregation ATPase
MAEFEAAAARLSVALDALEQRMSSITEAHARISWQASEAARINAERETLLARIAELEEEARTLSGATEEVEMKLDNAIGEIRAALDR